MAILDDVEQGCPSGKTSSTAARAHGTEGTGAADRREEIELALRAARRGDAVLMRKRDKRTTRSWARRNGRSTSRRGEGGRSRRSRGERSALFTLEQAAWAAGAQMRSREAPFEGAFTTRQGDEARTCSSRCAGTTSTAATSSPRRAGRRAGVLVTADALCQGARNREGAAVLTAPDTGRGAGRLWPPVGGAAGRP